MEVYGRREFQLIPVTGALEAASILRPAFLALKLYRARNPPTQ